jgi:hypothetical protein
MSLNSLYVSSLSKSFKSISSTFLKRSCFAFFVPFISQSMVGLYLLSVPHPCSLYNLFPNILYFHILCVKMPVVV